MSPTLFNLVLNKALEGYQGSVPYGESKLSYLAFADDLAIFGGTPKELQERLATWNSDYGLEINPSKCRCAHMKISKKKHTHYIAVKSEIHVGGVKIPNLNSDESYKYLGIQIKANGTRLCRLDWTVELDRIGKSLLKHRNIKGVLTIKLL